MSDIQPGDVVVCVGAALCSYDHTGHPDSLEEFGRAPLRVKEVAQVQPWGDYLIFTDGRGGCDGCFRKIDAADEQFTAQVRACRPIRNPVEA